MRSARTPTTAYVQDAWRAGDAVAGLFLDVKGAFPSVDLKMLAHEMRARGFPEEYVTWVQEKLRGQATVICFDDFCSQLLQISAGLDQGCPLSVILYTIYNSRLLEIVAPKGKKDRAASGFGDDVAALARGADILEANGKLVQMMEGEGGALEWARKANCEFEIDKFALIGFTRRMERKPLKPRRRQPVKRHSIRVGRTTIEPTSSTKFLGMLVNQTLSWTEQKIATYAKGACWAAQCRRIAKPMHGVPARFALQLYKAVCVPRMLYAVYIWGAPWPRDGKTGKRRKDGGRLGRLGGIQWQVLILLGAMQTTATDVLEAYANLLPFHLLLDKIRHQAPLRMVTLPDTHPIHHQVRKAARHVHIKRHKTSLHLLLAAYRDVRPGAVEEVQTVRRSPKWKAACEVEIAGDEEEAKAMIGASRADVKIFTDGSGFEGGWVQRRDWREGEV
jgi:hypothetical protein